MSGYGDFAYYYDLLTENVDYESRCDYIYNLLADNGVIVCEYDNGTNVDIKGFVPLKDKRYGRVCVKVLTRE